MLKMQLKMSVMKLKMLLTEINIISILENKLLTIKYTLKMKNLIYIVMFLVPTILFAQEKPKNVSEETTTKTIVIDNGKEVVEKKVEVTTREEEQLELDENDKNKVNQDLVSSPSKVTTTVKIDNDMDPFYDTKTESVKYMHLDDAYVFKRKTDGFIVSEFDNNSNMSLGQVYRTSAKNNYLYKSSDYNGVGYFDNNGNFIVEYYDAEKKGMVKKVFLLEK